VVVFHPNEKRYILVTTQPLKYLVQRINGINGWIANDFKRFYSHQLIENAEEKSVNTANPLY